MWHCVGVSRQRRRRRCFGGDCDGDAERGTQVARVERISRQSRRPQSAGTRALLHTRLPLPLTLAHGRVPCKHARKHAHAPDADTRACASAHANRRTRPRTPQLLRTGLSLTYPAGLRAGERERGAPHGDGGARSGPAARGWPRLPVLSSLADVPNPVSTSPRSAGGASDMRALFFRTELSEQLRRIVEAEVRT